MFQNLWNVPPLTPHLDEDLYEVTWYYKFKNFKSLNFIPDWATNNEVLNILELSFEFLIANKEELIWKYWWKAFWLILANSLKNKSCFSETSFYIPSFHTIPTNFFQFERKNKVNENDLKIFEWILDELNWFWPDTEISERIQNLVINYIWYIWKINNRSYIDFWVEEEDFSPLIAFAQYKSNPIIWNENEFAFHNEVWWYNYIKYKDFKLSILKQFLQNNHNILKYLLENLTPENLVSQYSFFIDFYSEYYNCDEYKTDEKWVYIFRNWTRVYIDPFIDWEFKYWFIDWLKIVILEFLWVTKRKTDDEIKSIDDFDIRKTKIINEQRWIETDEEAIWFLKKEDLRKQKDIFFWDDFLINFSREQDNYLKKVFDSFSWIPYIAVRSSADIEDNEYRNYSWVFYSWFCSTTDFNKFKQEVKKVLQSAMNIKDLDVKMWIVVMEASWIEKSIWGFNEKAFYPDWGWVMATTQFWDRTTISAEFWLPVWITSWKNKEAVTIDFDKEWNPLQACLKEFTTYELIIKNKFVISNWEVAQIYKPETLKFIWDWIGWIFDEDVYKDLVYIWKQLENIFGYSLDIEFAIYNRCSIHILQIRKFPDNYKRPDVMNTPDLENKSIIVDKSNILSSLWFLNNEKIHFYELNLPFISWHSSDRRHSDNSLIIERLNELEKENNGQPYALVMERIETFPNIDLEKYPWLKLVVFKWNENSYKLSHASMILRELLIPTIICDFDWFHDLSHICDETTWELIVYLDGNNWGYIYK